MAGNLLCVAEINNRLEKQGDEAMNSKKAMTIMAVAVLAAGLLLGGATPLGKPLTLKKPMAISKLMQSPDAYVGKVVQVRGKVTGVCEKAGCWMQLVEPASGASVRIKVKDGEIVFPQEAIGKMAVAEGTFAKIELTEEQALARAKHEAEEKGQEFDPAKFKYETTIYQIQGTGAVIE